MVPDDLTTERTWEISFVINRHEVELAAVDEN